MKEQISEEFARELLEDVDLYNDISINVINNWRKKWHTLQK